MLRQRKRGGLRKVMCAVSYESQVRSLPLTTAQTCRVEDPEGRWCVVWYVCGVQVYLTVNVHGARKSRDKAAHVCLNECVHVCVNLEANLSAGVTCD